jgi:hypothetical protein
MTVDVIPGDVQHFILQHIDSIAQLEGLLLLRNDRSVEWSARAVADRLYISEPEATLVLTQLASRELVAVRKAKPARYIYQPKTPDLGDMVDRVADIYAKYLVPVTHLVHSKPKTRIQEFSDAFWLRKE